MLPIYDRKIHDPVPNMLEISAIDEFILVEGMLLLEDSPIFEEIALLLDFVFYLDAPMEECHQRVVARKVKAGRTIQDAEAHYQKVDKPNIHRIQKAKLRAPAVLTLNNGLISKLELQR